ncbi:11028_t:CDS:2, partial [Entrophospora sp. SA101]
MSNSFKRFDQSQEMFNKSGFVFQGSLLTEIIKAVGDKKIAKERVLGPSTFLWKTTQILCAIYLELLLLR